MSIEGPRVAMVALVPMDLMELEWDGPGMDLESCRTVERLSVELEIYILYIITGP